MHEPLLASAALPQPKIIFGLLAKRYYSLGHELFLIRENNPLVTGGEVKREHIQRAAWICASTWTELFSEHDSFGSHFKRWIWRMRTKRSSQEVATAEFHSYRDAGLLQFPHSEIPRPVDRHTQTTRAPGSPFLLRLHSFVMTHLRLSEAEAWDYGAGLAKMRWQCHWEQEGGLDIANEHDASFKAYVEKREREKREKKGKK
jgi:hypothetical protein